MMIKIVQTLPVLFIFVIGLNSEETNNNSCWSTLKNYQIVSLDNSISPSQDRYSENDFVRECHLSFVENIMNKSCSNSSSSTSKGPPLIQKYGYGFLAVLIISALSLAGFVAFPLMKKPYYRFFNAFFTALAVGTLISDTVFELIPVIIEHSFSLSRSHEHGEFISEESKHDGIHVPLFIWQMTALVLTAYIFYVVELMIHAFLLHRKHIDENSSYNLNHQEIPTVEMSVLPISTVSKASRRESLISTNTVPNLTITADDHQRESTGWMIIIGDGIHNVADGLAIGAAFAENTIFGVTTAVAIACHELPTELGEFMVLVESGFSFRRALLFNFISACTAIVGFFIGASISQEESTRTWIFSITAGTFVYIALVDLWPSLMPETERFDWPRFFWVTLGYLSGVAIMFVLTIVEEKIVQTGDK